MTTEIAAPAEIQETNCEMNASALVRRYRFSVDAYHRLADAGILKETDRVELIEGEIIEMSPIGKRHAACVKRLNKILSRISEDGILGVQDPLLISEDGTEPEPDVMLLKPRADFYEETPPQPADVLLLVEVADTSLEYDRKIKMPLYARAGIAEAWIVNLEGNRIEIYTEPRNGSYTVLRIAQSGDAIAPQALPQASVEVDAVLGQASK